jgi:hypothetical protein
MNLLQAPSPEHTYRNDTDTDSEILSLVKQHRHSGETLVNTLGRHIEEQKAIAQPHMRSAYILGRTPPSLTLKNHLDANSDEEVWKVSNPPLGNIQSTLGNTQSTFVNTQSTLGNFRWC